MKLVPSSFSLVAALAALSVSPIQIHAQAPAAPAVQPPAQQASALATPVIERSAQGVVTITCATPGATIRYSLDGTDPGPKTGPYLEPIVLPAGGTVKARAFTEDRKDKSALAEVKLEAVPGTAPLPSTLVPCTQDRDWPIYDWAKRHAAVTQMGRNKKSTLVFIGDSITQMFGGEPHDRSQPGKDVWEKYYGKRNVLNLGYGYDFVENTLWRLRHGELDGPEAKVVVIHIGTNNVSRNTPEEIEKGIVAICDEVRQRQPKAKIVLMAIFPRGPKPDGTRTKLEAINKLVAEYVAKDGGGITFLDIGAKFLEPDGTISREVMGDFLHPTAKGYEIWAGEIEPVVAKLLGESVK